MGVFFAGAEQLHDLGGREPKRGYESVFSAADPAAGGGIFGAGGFRDWPGSDGGAGAVVWDPSAGDGAPAAGADCARGADGAGRGAVDLGAERLVPRRARGDGGCGAVLAAGVTGGGAELLGSGALALAVWAEPYGGGP